MRFKFFIMFVFLSIIIFAQDQEINLIWPLAKTGSRQFPTDGYGLTKNPMGGSQGRFHYGFDYACKVGTPVLAVADGTIIACVKNDPVLGNFIVLRIENGWDFTYGHLSETWYARGSKVKQGTIIGLSGNTGWTTGPHLHFQVTEDPMNLFKPRPSLPPANWEYTK